MRGVSTLTRHFEANPPALSVWSPLEPGDSTEAGFPFVNLNPLAVMAKLFGAVAAVFRAASSFSSSFCVRSVRLSILAGSGSSSGFSADADSWVAGQFEV